MKLRLLGTIWWVSLLIFPCLNSHFVSSKCLDEQKFVLLDIKRQLKFNSSVSSKLVQWNATSDCCQWSGIECDISTGQVISLDLSYESIRSRGIDDISTSSSLFSRLQSLRILNLAGNTELSANLEYIIGNVTDLSELYLDEISVYTKEKSWGEVLLSSLPHLRVLSMSNCNLTGEIPSLSNLMNLTRITLQDNSLSGSITSTKWSNLASLEVVNLSNNSLSGSIPESLFSVLSLREVDLQQNRFGGWKLDNYVNNPSLNLSYLDLSRNRFEGEVPKWISLLTGLGHLDLSWNMFNCTLELNQILHQLLNLRHLDLSHNRISVHTNGGIVSNMSFPRLNFLYLAACNLKTVPEFLKNQSQLVDLDLSDNQIKGRVPSWVWKVGSGIQVAYARFRLLNLSCNGFSDLEPIPKIPGVVSLDLHSNNLQGQVPALPYDWELRYLDFSSNNYTSIHPGIGRSITVAVFFSVAKNNIYGDIPESLCQFLRLEVLELGYNFLNGVVPDCLIQKANTLAVLSLRQNRLEGCIPDKFSDGCMLQTLDLNGNLLQGQVPRSLNNCDKLRVLDLGKNRLQDSFPCQLRSLSALQVLVLRSNKFHGPVACNQSTALWPLLQIVDLASNKFNGKLSSSLLRNWKSMMIETNLSNANLLHYSENMVNAYYQDQVSLSYKGTELEFEKILTMFTSIDLSDNDFNGVLPGELEYLKGLRGLNLSHNHLTGEIPSSIGNLTKLESLDLSFNSLTGKIPQQFTELNFLQALNVSFNKLTGEIPTGTQLQARDASSYIGNLGLCGPPLQLSCRKEHGSDNGRQQKSETQLDWLVSGAEVGFPVGMAVIIGPLFYVKRWRQWVDRLSAIILFQDDRRRVRTRGPQRAKGQCHSW